MDIIISTLFALSVSVLPAYLIRFSIIRRQTTKWGAAFCLIIAYFLIWLSVTFHAQLSHPEVETRPGNIFLYLVLWWTWVILRKESSHGRGSFEEKKSFQIFVTFVIFVVGALAGFMWWNSKDRQPAGQAPMAQTVTHPNRQLFRGMPVQVESREEPKEEKMAAEADVLSESATHKFFAIMRVSNPNRSIAQVKIEIDVVSERFGLFLNQTTWKSLRNTCPECVLDYSKVVSELDPEFKRTLSEQSITAPYVVAGNQRVIIQAPSDQESLEICQSMAMQIASSDRSAYCVPSAGASH